VLTFRTKRKGASLSEQLRVFASGRARAAAQGAMQRALLDLVDEGFEQEQSPAGSRWARRKPPTGSWPLLNKTGAMRGSIYASVLGAQIILHAGADYAGYHQSGTSRMPARPIFPDGALPANWAAVIDRAVRDALRTRSRGGRGTR